VVAFDAIKKWLVRRRRIIREAGRSSSIREGVRNRTGNRGPRRIVGACGSRGRPRAGLDIETVCNYYVRNLDPKVSENWRLKKGISSCTNAPVDVVSKAARLEIERWDNLHNIRRNSRGRAQPPREKFCCPGRVK